MEVSDLPAETSQEPVETDPIQNEPVPGVVRLMTEEPLEVPGPSAFNTLRERWAEAVNRRPWIIPAGLLGAAGLFLLVRRRR